MRGESARGVGADLFVFRQRQREPTLERSGKLGGVRGKRAALARLTKSFLQFWQLDSFEMSTSSTALTSRKYCFVTIGATAAFDSLIRATISSTFLEVLEQHGYTDLCIQHGKDGRAVLQDFANHCAKNGTSHNIHISGYDFNKQGLGAEMRAAKGHDNSDEGVVISHAGTCSLLHCTPVKSSQLTQALARYSMPFESLSH